MFFQIYTVDATICSTCQFLIYLFVFQGDDESPETCGLSSSMPGNTVNNYYNSLNSNNNNLMFGQGANGNGNGVYSNGYVANQQGSNGYSQQQPQSSPVYSDSGNSGWQSDQVRTGVYDRGIEQIMV